MRAAVPSLRDSCGSYAGWLDHLFAGEEPCPACDTAHVMRAKARRFRAGAVRDPYRCPACGSIFNRHTCGGAP